MSAENSLIQSVISTESIGSPAWWKKIKVRGTPLVLSVSNRESEVLFLWRNPPDSPVAAVYIEITGITDHHQFDTACLSRYPQTDVWFYQCRITRSWCGSYSFIPVDTRHLQPVYTGSIQAQSEQHRQWLHSTLFELAEPDPLNQRNLSECLWGKRKSPFWQTDRQCHFAWHDFDKARGRCTNSPEQAFIWSNPKLGNHRSVWLHSTTEKSNENTPLVIVLDGNFWSQEMPLFSALDTATQSGLIREAVYVFIDSLDLAQRETDLCCNKTFWQEIEQDLLPEGFITA